MHKKMSKVYVCLKVDDVYSAEYVNKLYNMIARADPHYCGKLFCYTDNPTGLNENIQPLIIDDTTRYEKWWYKIPLLVHPALVEFKKKIFFDLDIVIHGKLDFIDDVKANKLTICKAYWKHPSYLDDPEELNTLYNSSVMVWEDASYVYKHFEKNEDYYMLRYKGIDRYFHHERIDVDVLPEGFVYSYRKGASLNDSTPFTFRKNYHIAIFHQIPKQHELSDHPIVEKYWK